MSASASHVPRSRTEAARLACLLTGAPLAALWLVDGQGRQGLAACHGLPQGSTPELSVWQSRLSAEGPVLARLDSADAQGMRVMVALPLGAGKQCAGYLCVFDGRPAGLDEATAGRLAPLVTMLTAQCKELSEARDRVERAERAANHDARRFGDLADSLPVFVWTATPEGVVDYFGKPLVEYSGVPAEALAVPGAWLDLLHPDDREPVVEAWSASVATGQPYSVHFRIRRHDGEYRWFWVSARAVCDAEGAISVWYGCAADINDEVRLQQESRALAARLSDTFASIQDVFFALDGEGRVTALNEVARRRFAAEHEVIGLPAWKAFESLWRTRLAVECRTVMQHRKALRFELFLDERSRWFEVSIFPADKGVTVLLRDIDQRIRDEMVNTAESRVLGMIAAGAELEAVLEYIVRGVEAAMPGAIGSILFYDARSGTLHHGAAPGLPEAYNILVDGLAAGPQTGSCGTAAWTRASVIASDIESDPRWERFREQVRPFGLRACWSTPVLDSKGEVMATFAMYYRAVRVPCEEDQEVIRRAVSLVAIAIGRSREQCALRASEERFRSVFRDAATGMVIKSISGEVIEANEAYCRMLGYGLEELRAHDFLSITHPDDRPRYREVFETLRTGESTGFVIEKRYLTKSGQVVWARVSTSVQREGGRPVRVVAVTEDVTERHLAEETLRQQSALLAMASRLGQLGAWMVEAPSGRLIWSGEVRNMLEVPVEHVPDLQKDVATLYTPESALAVANAVRECMERGTAIDMEADIHTLRGRLLHVHILGEAVRDETGRIVRVQGTLQNVTEQHRLIRRLADSEARFRELAESVQDVFWMRALTGSTILYVSPAYEQVWGRSCAELYERPLTWLESILPEDRPLMDARLKLDPSQAYEIEYRIRRPDGEVRWIVDRGFPVFGQSGEVVRVTGVARDITDRKYAEQQLRSALDQLARSNRELESFAYVASHDLQEPLRKIKLFSDRLTERSRSLGEVERDYLDRMASAAGRMQTLIHDLLEYSRLTTRVQPMQAVALDDVVDEALADFDIVIAETGARIEREPLPQVVGDPSQLRQLVVNLIGNALKFRRPGVPPVLRVFADCPAGAPCLCVADNGIGLDAAQAERIFRPFQRLHTREEYVGSGIGLAIVKKIAERHGARVEVLSRPGEGAEFRVCFARDVPEEEG